VYGTLFENKMYPLSVSPPNPGGEESPFPYLRGRVEWGTYSKLLRK